MEVCVMKKKKEFSLKPEDIEILEGLQQHVILDVQILESITKHDVVQLHPGAYENLRNVADHLNYDLFNMFRAFTELAEYPLSKEQAQAFVEKAKEFNASLPEYVVKASKAKD